MPDDRSFVFFDFDGTLNDFETAYRRALVEVQRWAADRDPRFSQVDGEAWLGAWSDAWFALWSRYLAGEVSEEDLQAQRVQGALQRLGIEGDAALCRGMRRQFQEAVDRHLRLYPDARPVLEALRGRFRLGLLSNGAAGEQRQRVRRLGIEGYFDAVVISGEVGVHKPDPQIFAHALRAAGLAAGADPAGIVMVGDSPHGDVSGARRAGWTAVWLDRGGAGAWPDDLPPPHQRVRDLWEFAAWLTAGA